MYDEIEKSDHFQQYEVPDTAWISQDEMCEPHTANRETNARESLSTIESARNEFNRNRKLEIRHVPGITAEQVKKLLGEFEAEDIKISQRYKHAIVLLKDVSQCDDLIDKLNGLDFNGTKIDVRYFPRKKLLCVGGLPADMHEADFLALIQSYGPTEMCFLMPNDQGVSKGYGFVEYAKTYDEVVAIQQLLDGKSLTSGDIILCDFIHYPFPSFEQLGPTCLCVTNLPSNFLDNERLKAEFSILTEPLFCRVSQNPDVQSDFAIVEFAEPQVAEQTYNRLQDLKIDDQNVKIQMCMPGHSVPEAFNRQLSMLRRQKLNTCQRSTGLQTNIISSKPDDCTVPAVDPKLLNLLDKKHPSVLSSFKRMLQRLEEYQRHQQSQCFTDKPGLLGNGPSHVTNFLTQLNVQIAILSVHLASQAQQLLPCATNMTLMKVLPAGSNVMVLSNNPSVVQATCLIQTMLADYSFHVTEATEDKVLPLKRSPVKPSTGSNTGDDDKSDTLTDSNKVPSLLSVSVRVPSLLNAVNTLNDDEAVDILSSLDKLFAHLQNNLGREDALFEEKQSSDERNKAKNDHIYKTDAEHFWERPGILGNPPPPPTPVVDPVPSVCPQRPVFIPCTTLASYIEGLLHASLNPSVDPKAPLNARVPTLVPGDGGVVSLFDLPLIKPIANKLSHKVSGSGDTKLSNQPIPSLLEINVEQTSGGKAAGNGRSFTGQGHPQDKANWYFSGTPDQEEQSYDDTNQTSFGRGIHKGDNYRRQIVEGDQDFRDMNATSKTDNRAKGILKRPLSKMPVGKNNQSTAGQDQDWSWNNDYSAEAWGSTHYPSRSSRSADLAAAHAKAPQQPSKIKQQKMVEKASFPTNASQLSESPRSTWQSKAKQWTTDQHYTYDSYEANTSDSYGYGNYSEATGYGAGSTSCGPQHTTAGSTRDSYGYSNYSAATGYSASSTSCGPQSTAAGSAGDNYGYSNSAATGYGAGSTSRGPQSTSAQSAGGTSHTGSRTSASNKNTGSTWPEGTFDSNFDESYQYMNQYSNYQVKNRAGIASEGALPKQKTNTGNWYHSQSWDTSVAYPMQQDSHGYGTVYGRSTDSSSDQNSGKKRGHSPAADSYFTSSSVMQQQQSWYGDTAGKKHRMN